MCELLVKRAVYVCKVVMIIQIMCLEIVLFLCQTQFSDDQIAGESYFIYFLFFLSFFLPSKATESMLYFRFTGGFFIIFFEIIML